MRRSPIVLSATAVGLVGVLSFEPRKPSLPTLAAATPAPAAATTASTPPAASGTTGSTGATGSTTAAAPASTATKVATGSAISTEYGVTQVRVRIKGGKITAVEALALPANERKSEEISYQAEPLLRQSALTKQSAAIDTVSGATFTSASYEASLQSALDKAGFKAADGSRGSETLPAETQDGPGPGDGGPPGSFPNG